MNVDNLKTIVRQFSTLQILVVGDVMLDRYVQGTVSRISPEAPVPVVEATSEVFRPGGAANTASNIRTLGGDVIIVGLVGDDSNGQKLIDLLKRSGVHTEGLIVDRTRPTTLKTRIIGDHQHLVRIDSEVRRNIDKKQTRQILDFVNEKIKNVDAVLISDYEKGVNTRVLLEKMISLIRVYETPIIVDPKVRHFPYYRGVTLITPNVKEASSATQIDLIDEASIRNMGRELLRQLECDAVLITRGKNGMTLFERNGNITNMPTLAREVYDVTGAGDTVASALSLGLAAGADTVDAVAIANVAAGIVIEKLGGATVNQDEINHRFDMLGRTRFE